MTRRRRRPGRATVARLSAGLAATAVLGAALAAGSSASAVAVPVKGSLPAAIVLSQVSPAALTRNDDVVVVGTVTNAGTAALVGASAVLRLDPTVRNRRDLVAAWARGGDTDPAGSVVPGHADVLTSPLAPGATASFRLSVPAARLGLGSSGGTFGPRGIAVEVTGRDKGGQDLRRLALTRTFLVWTPPVKEYNPTTVSLLVPVQSSLPADDAGSPTTPLLAEMAPGGRLDRVLSATADRAIAWAVDPALLTAAQRARSGQPPTVPPSVAVPTPTATDQRATSGAGTAAATATPAPTPEGTADAARFTAARWLDRISAERRGRQVAALPWADPDLAAVAHGKGTSLLRQADGAALAAMEQVWTTRADVGLAWPAEGAADQATLTMLAAEGRTDVVLAAANQPPTVDQGYDPTGRSVVSTPAGQLRGLLFDQTLSGEFTDAAGADPVRGRQLLLADLAAVTLQRPGVARHLLMVAPRGWDPDPVAAAAAVSVVGTVPWATLAPLSTLTDGPAPVVTRAAPGYPPEAAASEIPAKAVQALVGAQERLTRFLPVLTDPEPVGQPLHAAILSMLSVAWRDSPDASAARSDVIGAVDRLYAGVRIVPGATTNLLATSADLPVTLSNSLDRPVRVVLTLHPRSGRLTVQEARTIQIGPGERPRVRVPIRAVANGDVAVDAVLTSPEGDVISQTTTIEVRVLRNWESRGILVVFVILVALVLVGLLRGVRRGRTRIPAGAVPDVDDDPDPVDVGGSGRAEATPAVVDQPSLDETGDRPADEQPADHGPSDHGGHTEAAGPESAPPGPEPAPVPENPAGWFREPAQEWPTVRPRPGGRNGARTPSGPGGRNPSGTVGRRR